MKRFFTLCILCSLITHFEVCAQLPQLVVDVNPDGNSDITRLDPIGDKLYFSGNTGTGRTMWHTDGTPEGTTEFFVPGEDQYSGHSFTSFNDEIFFVSGSETLGQELYVTDGTAEGTELFTEVYPGEGSGVTYMIGVINDRLFFLGNDGVNGVELWSTDGTVSGTAMVRDINPAGNGVTGYFFTSLNDRLLFTANDNVNANELWISDGTEAGTVMLKDTNPIGGMSIPSYIAWNDELYFFTNSSDDGSSMWKTDGTTDGTVMVINLSEDGLYGVEKPLIYDGKMYFTLGSILENYGDIWSTDGTAQGTALYRENSETGTVFNDELYFVGVNANNYYAIYKTSAIPGDEEMIMETQEATAWNFPSRTFQVWNDRLYFLVRYNDSSANYAWSYMYSTDGTAAGTEQHMNLAGTGGMLIRHAAGLVVHNGSMYFITTFFEVNEELYRFAGLPANVEQTPDTDSISVYPNPVHDALNIAFNNTSTQTIQITDMQGRVVLEQRPGSGHVSTVNVSHLVEGVYTLRTTNESGERVVQKFVKE